MKHRISISWKNKPACFIGLARCNLELKKYELALLSNTNELHFDYLYKDYSDFFKNFKKLHLSYLMNLRKPDIEIYNEVLKYHNIKPENMFFTDDNQENIDAAKKAGIRAYTFKNVIKLKQDLADFGIEIW